MQINYSDYEASRQKKSTATKKEFKVGYFSSLRDDGDEAIVRFAYDDLTSFKVVTVHKVKVGDYFRNVSCLRNAFEPLDKCPLCAKGDQVKSRAFITLIEYTKDDAGIVVPTAKVWERPVAFIKDIINAYNNAIEMGIYSSDTKLGDVVFKIKRTGVKGSMQTTYQVVPANPSIFKSDIYVKDFSSFDGFDLAHHSYMERTADEINTFLSTGSFPAREKPTKTVDDVTTDTIDNTPTTTSTLVANTNVVVDSSEPAKPRRFTF